jgi:hypothetical protein
MNTIEKFNGTFSMSHYGYGLTMSGRGFDTKHYQFQEYKDGYMYFTPIGHTGSRKWVRPSDFLLGLDNTCTVSNHWYGIHLDQEQDKIIEFIKGLRDNEIEFYKQKKAI